MRWLRDCKQIDQILLVSGARAEGLSEETLRSVRWIPVAEFDYDRADDASESLADRSSRIAMRLEASIREAGLSKDDSILHWHNHSLGKNTAAPSSIRRLAKAGWRLLLQIHDFAEDNRPENYQRLIEVSGAADKSELDRYLYPVSNHIHYATLSRSDASVLTRLGILSTYCLPNSVALSQSEQPAKEHALAKVCQAMQLPPNARWSLYPVRGIRRKNVGELLLISRWLREDHFAGITLAPTTPVERRSYERWRTVASEFAPQAIFDAGHHADVSFTDNIAAADSIVSTSVAEGFGMAFLEPWLAQREVIARRLPTVTNDFEACGVMLPKLYDQIPIPGDPTWIRACRDETKTAMAAAWATVPTKFRPNLEVDAADSTCIDFARLTPQRQVEILVRSKADAGFESAVKSLSADLVRQLSAESDPHLVADNARVIGDHYSIASTGAKLLQIYDTLQKTPTDGPIDGPGQAGIGVDLINRTRPFFPCRTEVMDV